MFSDEDFLQLQKDQYAHDVRHHSDITSLHKTERLKHYGLHFAKYVGRLAREAEESKPIERTLVDAFLISLSAANTLHQRLGDGERSPQRSRRQVDPLRTLADAVGRFADACEKIDHLEEFVALARRANVDVMHWIVDAADERSLDLVSAATDRRKELKARCFYLDN
ncbi:hypothetical protein [Methyloceanibacter sp. wino2]|uniref:hypothetical protein n=1 Tax=Methyloceanibacter sp. wino2 TaxID=2170729 RepID=UPI000D3E2ACD|nr:hypothetical protein [Methyloceanibacter sp. wino2]